MYLGSSEGKQFLLFVSLSTVVAFEQVLSCCSVGLSCSGVVALLFIMLQ